MRRKIWVMNHYAGSTFFDQGGRHYYFAKYLKQYGEVPVIFCCNAIHNGFGHFFQDESLFHVHMADAIQVPFVFVKGRAYVGNGMGRILNMFDFYRNVKMAAKAYANEYGTPDIIYASSVHPLTLIAGIQLAKYFHIKCICEIRDLWPETFISYQLLSKYHPLMLILRRVEKWIYQKADRLVFTMEGAYDYIKERGWEKDIPQSKIYHINNGVDLVNFDYNRDHWSVDDIDLQDESVFTVVYAGSIRRVNNLGKLIDVAKAIKNQNIKFLIWGKGDELPMLQKRVEDENILNVVFKGYVDKKYVPYITAHADLNLVHNRVSPIWRFGASLNKMFDYMAAGKPILVDFPCKYNPVVQCSAGIEVEDPAPDNIARVIENFTQMSNKTYAQYGKDARKGAERYDFRNLTKKLLEIMTGEVDK